MKIQHLTGLALLALSLANPGCSDEAASTTQKAIAAEAIGEHDCASCGMIVREQPAPRGQLVHRDGKRVFFCSIGDLTTYLQAPSPHGAAQHVFVETVAPDVDPSRFDPSPRPWIKAEAGHYVVGIPRDRVMGDPVLVFDDAESAAQIAQMHGGRVVDWTALRAPQDER